MTRHREIDSIAVIIKGTKVIGYLNKKAIDNGLMKAIVDFSDWLVVLL